VIVVIGSLRLRGAGPDVEVVGLAASIAISAAEGGAGVEVVGKVGDDPAGDAALLALAHKGVGHVALLRDPARQTPTVPAIGELIDRTSDDLPQKESGRRDAGDPPTLEAADAGLALRYLPEISVIVAVHQPPEVLVEAAAAAGWAETSLVVVVPLKKGPPDGLPDRAVSLAAADDDESAVGQAIGRYAAALDRGEPAEAAHEVLIAAGRG
jgi:hypothetical protein